MDRPRVGQSGQQRVDTDPMTRKFKRRIRSEKCRTTHDSPLTKNPPSLGGATSVLQPVHQTSLAFLTSGIGELSLRHATVVTACVVLTAVRFLWLRIKRVSVRERRASGRFQPDIRPILNQNCTSRHGGCGRKIKMACPSSTEKKHQARATPVLPRPVLPRSSPAIPRSRTRRPPFKPR